MKILGIILFLLMGFTQSKPNSRFARAQYLAQACREEGDVFERCKVIVHVFGPIKKRDKFVDSIWVDDREYKIKHRLLVIGGKGKENNVGTIFSCINKETGQASLLFIVEGGIYYRRNGSKTLEMHITQMQYFSVYDKKFIKIIYE